MLRPALALVTLVALTGAAEAKPKPKAKTATAAGVLEVRKLYQEIVGAEETGRLTLKERKAACEMAPYEVDSRLLAVDPEGRPRILVVSMGSEDSVVSVRQYYDASGHLRFVLVEGRAVNDSELEHRIWLDAKGRRIKETHQYVKGPGYTFPNPWPQESLTLVNPRAAFEAPFKCIE